MGKRIEFLKIIDNQKLNKDSFILELSGKEKLPEVLPGQFAEFKVEGSPDTFLRRPFSVHDINYGENTMKFLIQIAGKGTEALSKLETGNMINVIYPLGNSFSLPESKQRILLVGGGCGVAPLLFMAKFLKEQGFTFDVLLGFRNNERIIEYDEYIELGRVFLTTEDGSRGEKGFITEHSVLKANNYDRIYCCGPMPMMKAVGEYCIQMNIECEVSLETLMGCGIGACLCCTVTTVKGNLCTCTDGPVFNNKDLIW
jgi:dihydroorotate dehydrogenase electron transfer subunit